MGDFFNHVAETGPSLRFQFLPLQQFQALNFLEPERKKGLAAFRESGGEQVDEDFRPVFPSQESFPVKPPLVSREIYNIGEEMDQIFIEKENANSFPLHFIAGIAKKVFRLAIGIEDAGMNIGKQESGWNRIEKIMAPLQDFAHVSPFFFTPNIMAENCKDRTKPFYFILPAKKVNVFG
jgi:hypothetical protein